MSWLSQAWRWLKKQTQMTDAELAFSAAVATLGAGERASLQGKLRNVQFAVDTARQFVLRDARLDEAKQWVDGALNILGGDS